MPRNMCLDCAAVAAAVIVVTVSLHPCRAETLEEMLREVAAHQPALQALRVKALATSEEVAIAQAGYMPKLSATGTAGASQLPSDALASLGTPDRSASVAVTLQQPVFDGFRTTSAVAEASEQLEAERQDVAGAELDVLLDAITAYLDVQRDRTIITLRKRSLRVLTDAAAMARERLASRDATSIEVDVAEARVADARFALAGAGTAAAASAASYTSMVGAQPGKLAQVPVPVKRLPTTLDMAVELAARDSPLLRSAKHRVQAAQHAVSKADADRLPTVSLEARYEHDWGYLPLGRDDDISVGVRVSVPVLDGGVAAARGRQARLQGQQRALELDDLRRRLRARLATLWSRFSAAGAQVEAGKRAVLAGRKALAALTEVSRSGERTILEVLDTERDLIDAEVRLAAATHDRVLRAYAILASTGHLEVGN